MWCVFAGGGSLKASLARVFSLAKNEQENSEQVIKKRCHAELDSASNHLGVLQGSQGVGLKAQPTVDSHMLSLREGQSPTKQSTCLYGLPRILTNARNDKMAGICECDGLISHNALSPYHPIALLPKKLAFTMAEILLSLTIIGVVAAITLPSLTGNINERTWNAQRKALYSRISQSVALMPALNGYGVVKKEEKDDAGNVTQTAEDTAAETFLSAGLSKVLKINNICDSEHLSDCGLSESYINHSGTKITPFPKTLVELFPLFDGEYTYYGNNGNAYVVSRSVINTKVAAFETANGESIVAYYNPICKPDMHEVTWYAQEKMCLNLLYDLNGKKGPNTIGKDMGFMTVFYPTDSIVVSFVPVRNGKTDGTVAGSVKFCKNIDAVMPNQFELAALSINSLNYRKELTGCHQIVSGTRYYHSDGTVRLRQVSMCSGAVGLSAPLDSQNGIATHCIRR